MMEENRNTYQAVIPEEQHIAEGKDTAETAHVERWNNTLRQRLARFVRNTLSFSKSLEMHDACQKLFLYRYNFDIVYQSYVNHCRERIPSTSLVS